MTKLQLIAEDGPPRRLMLADQDGAPLPGQRDLVYSRIGHPLQRITVTFEIDGDKVSIAPSARAEMAPPANDNAPETSS